MDLNGQHITYCLNIHRGDTLAEVKDAIARHAVRVKAALCPHAPFGLGLRLSNRAADELLTRTSGFATFLHSLGMYAFTVNGFPFGEFHDRRVKDNAYRPDWSDPRRLDYTVRLARILTDLLPDGVQGSISTVPLCYGKKAPPSAFDRLYRLDETLDRMHAQTGRWIGIALEPEPDCCIETAREAADLWQRRFADAPHIGLCFDTCHFSTNFERPVDALRTIVDAGAPVWKIQVSSSLQVDVGAHTPTADWLTPYDDGIYFHQVRVRDGTGRVLAFPDMDEALAAGPPGQWRLHFHVPLHWPGDGRLGATHADIDGPFLRLAAGCCRHFEVETYTFHVMPERRQSIEESIIGELRWLLERMPS